MNPLSNRFGVPGAISVIALVFALVGGAYAAENNSGDGATASAKKKNNRAKKNRKGNAGLNGKQKRQVIALAKRFAGAGPMGPQGVPGLPGAPGSDGDDGSDGSNGSNGKEGKEGKEGEEGEEGEPGTPGPEGPEGSPWVAGTVPSGQVMKGTWVLPTATAGAANEFFYAAASTVVPLGGDLAGVGEPTTVPFCKGTAAEPTPAESPLEEPIPGFLCVYPSEAVNMKTLQLQLQGSRGGAVLRWASKEAGAIHGFGSWAMYTP